MAYVKEHAPTEVYHLTKKENLNSILEDGMIRRFGDTECWFCADLQKMKAYMEQTVMCEGKHYYSVTGQLSANRPAADRAAAHRAMISSGAVQAVSAALCSTAARVGSSLGMA